MPPHFPHRHTHDRTLLLLASACHSDMPDEQRLAIMREVARREEDMRWTSRLLGGWWRTSPRKGATQNEAMEMLTEYEGTGSGDGRGRHRRWPGSPTPEGFENNGGGGAGWPLSSIAMTLVVVSVLAVVVLIMMLGVRRHRR